MFDQLSIDPDEVFGVDFDNRIFADPTTEDIPNEGVEVLVAFSEENKAVYIDGEKVHESDHLALSRMMYILSDKTDGHFAAFAEKEAVYNRTNGEGLYSMPFPEDPADIVFGEELDMVYIYDAQDLREKLQSSSSDYVIVVVRSEAIDEEMVREYASDDFARKIFEIRGAYLDGRGDDQSVGPSMAMSR